MSETYEPGELFVYMNGDHWELGEVKRPNNTGDGYFCWYSEGDTAANTPTSCMHKLANAVWSHVEKLREENQHIGLIAYELGRKSLMQENEELRKQLQDAEHEESIAWDRVRSAERRNDKLLKLLVDFRNDMWRAGEWTEPFDERMRELGVEV